MTDAQATPEERAGFCQNCGKPLSKETIRVVGTAVYCEPCLAAKLAGAPPYVPGGGPVYTPVNSGTGPAMYSAVREAVISGVPNPVLAGFLGLIPGVGAMYNEQYAKGIVHLVIFAVLSSLSDANGIFGLLAFGWVCYMAIEAYNTARARRDGTPLPNPFGLNEIGERMGFGRAWPGGVRPVPAPNAVPDPSAAAPVPGAETPVPPPPAGASWGAPSDQYGYPAPGYVPPIPPVPPMPPVFWESSSPGAPSGVQFGNQYGAGYSPGVPPYSPVAAPGVVPPLPPQSRFPVGAVWLIALGAIFLVGNTGFFHIVRPGVVVGFGLIALSVWLFTRSMTMLGQPLVEDGSPMYRMRVLRALRGPVWVLLVGVLLVLDQFNLIHWHRSWPYFIILAGVMTILERSVANTMAAGAYTYPPAPMPSSQVEPAANSESSSTEGGR